VSAPQICPCGAPAHPRQVSNRPGLTVIDYRAGDFSTFRHALLHALDGERQLAPRWRPGADGDLAVQMVEWWSYLADILTLYTERAAHQQYVRTADLPESVNALIRLLGYRPRPGIGAHGVVAALLSGRNAVTIPKGFPVQSKPGPGKTPQMFEVDADTVVTAPEAVALDLPPSSTGLSASALLRGSIASVKKGDRVLVVKRGWSGGAGWDYGNVSDVRIEKDPRGANNTRIFFTPALNLPSGATPRDYLILRGAQSAFVWHYTGSGAQAVYRHVLVLQSAVRQIHPGDLILLTTFDGSLGPTLQLVNQYSEAVWYANQTGTDPAVAPLPPTPPIPVLRSELNLATLIQSHGLWELARSKITVLFRWLPAGELIPEPATSLANNPTLLTASGRATFPPADINTGGYNFLVEDATGGGGHATGHSRSNANELDLQKLEDMTQASLAAPLRAMFGLLPVSRGETVANEVLGSGDATQSGQEFVLKKSPLTYLFDPTSSSGQNYRSTLHVWVDGFEWTEAPSFYGQAANAKIFVTREDDQGKTHVVFGDWANGSGLPSGAGNVTASYRIGSGAEMPGSGTLTVVPKPLPGLKSIRNPVAVSGGSDSDPAERIRLYAPRSVMTFGRAVSAVDYETIAAQTPSVARARAYWSWDLDEQRNVVKVYVGDDAGAVSAAKTALSGAEDPNRPVQVFLAQPVDPDFDLNIRVQRDPHYRVDDIGRGVKAALHDVQTGLFGRRRVRIGEPFYASQIAAACMSVTGVVAVHLVSYPAPATIPGVRWDPGEGNFWALVERDTFVDVTDA
jgi:hypothetical protein